MGVPLPDERFAKELAEIAEFYGGNVEVQWYPGSDKITVIIYGEYGEKKVIRGRAKKVIEQLYKTHPVPLSRVLDWVKKNNGRAGGNGTPAPERATTPERGGLQEGDAAS
ncbi:MAG: hypothetical protein QXR87_06820 [Candidatus Hadarchaeales archaeon]